MLLLGVSLIQEDVDKSQVRAHERFKKGVNSQEERLFEVSCPGCSETFFVDLDELERRLGYADEVTEGMDKSQR